MLLKIRRGLGLGSGSSNGGVLWMSEQANLNELKEELEELITLLAQTSDSTAINLATKFERFAADLEERDAKRWSFFRWFVGSVIAFFSICIPVFWVGIDKMYTTVNENTKQIALLAAENKDQITKHELSTAVEKRFILLESSIKDAATVRDLEKMKNDLMQFVIRYHSGGRKQ
jgi:hypothetical protein